MSRPVLGATAVVAFALAVSSCSAATHDQEPPGSPTPVSASPSDSSHPRSQEFPLADRLLAGEFAGTVFQPQERNSNLPGLGSVFGHCGTCEITPNQCSSTGLKGFSPDSFIYHPEEVAGSLAETDAGRIAVMLGFDPVEPEDYTSGPEGYRKHAEECAVATGSTYDYDDEAQEPFTRRVELQPSPEVEGASDVVAAITTFENEDGVESSYVIVGNVGIVAVAVQSRPPANSQGTPDVDMANEVFKAQVQKLKS